jgi:hypothetical protein
MLRTVPIIDLISDAGVATRVAVESGHSCPAAGARRSRALECGDISRRFAFDVAAKAATTVAALVCRACSTAGKFKSSANLMEVKGSEAQGVSREIVRRKRGAKARADEQERDERLLGADERASHREVQIHQGTEE